MDRHMQILISDFCELNMSNYDADDVARLNDWAIGAYDALNELNDRIFKFENALTDIRDTARDAMA